MSNAAPGAKRKSFFVGEGLAFAPCVANNFVWRTMLKPKKTLGIISCGKKKAAIECQAKDLYTGSFFYHQRRYVEKHCDRWAILSAKYGLMHPDVTVRPYEMSIDSMTPGQLKLWGEWVRGQISLMAGDDAIVTTARGKYLEAFSGMTYTQFPDGPVRGIGDIISALKGKTT